MLYIHLFLPYLFARSSILRTKSKVKSMNFLMSFKILCIDFIFMVVKNEKNNARNPFK